MKLFKAALKGEADVIKMFVTIVLGAFFSMVAFALVSSTTFSPVGSFLIWLFIAIGVKVTVGTLILSIINNYKESVATKKQKRAANEELNSTLDKVKQAAKEKLDEMARIKARDEAIVNAVDSSPKVIQDNIVKLVKYSYELMDSDDYNQIDEKDKETISTIIEDLLPELMIAYGQLSVNDKKHDSVYTKEFIKQCDSFLNGIQKVEEKISEKRRAHYLEISETIKLSLRGIETPETSPLDD